MIALSLGEDRLSAAATKRESAAGFKGQTIDALLEASRPYLSSEACDGVANYLGRKRFSQTEIGLTHRRDKFVSGH